MKTRLRTYNRWFRKPLVIVQVAELRHHTDPLTIEATVWEHWRDATPDDFLRGGVDAT